MARRGLFGKLVDAFTSDEQERREREMQGKKHGGILGAIEEQVTPDKHHDKHDKHGKDDKHHKDGHH